MDKTLFKQEPIGSRKDGRPIFRIAGGSEPVVETPPAFTAGTQDAPAAPAARTPAAPAPAGRTFSAEDIENARKQEKDKLYESVETLKRELEVLRTEREQRLADEKKKQEEAAAKAKQKQEEEMSAKDLIAQKEQEWQARLDALQREREEERVILERERQFATLQAYVQRRVTEESDNIAPELIDLVSGNNEQEVEQSIAMLRAKSQAIAESAATYFQNARANMRGVSVTGYSPVGPMDSTDPLHQTYSADDIKNMSVAEYAEFRKKANIGGGSQQNRGLFS